MCRTQVENDRGRGAEIVKNSSWKIKPFYLEIKFIFDLFDNDILIKEQVCLLFKNKVLFTYFLPLFGLTFFIVSKKHESNSQYSNKKVTNVYSVGRFLLRPFLSQTLVFIGSALG